MSDYILEMDHITKEFSGVKALDDVNLKVKKARSTPYAERTEQESRP